MTSERTRSLTRTVGFAAGLALAALAVALLRVPAGAADAGLELRVEAAADGELAVGPPGEALRANDLRPGERSRGRIVITNQTATTGPVDLRASFDDPLAARAVGISISDRSGPIFEGSLEELGERLRIERGLSPGGSRRLRVEAAIDPTAERGWRGATLGTRFELSLGSGRR